MTTMILVALLAGVCGFLAGRRPEHRWKNQLLPPVLEVKMLPAVALSATSAPAPSAPQKSAEDAEREAKRKAQEKLKREFERVLNAADFRLHLTGYEDRSSPFDGRFLKIGDRSFTSPRDAGEALIAYDLPRYAKCCEHYSLYRLAKPRADTAGLGPTVCAACGKVEWDHDDSPELRNMIGKATYIFPVLSAATRRDDLYAGYVRLEIMMREQSTLYDRSKVLKLDIAQLRKRLRESASDVNGPYRTMPLLAETNPEPKTPT